MPTLSCWLLRTCQWRPSAVRARSCSTCRVVAQVWWRQTCHGGGQLALWMGWKRSLESPSHLSSPPSHLCSSHVHLHPQPTSSHPMSIFTSVPVHPIPVPVYPMTVSILIPAHLYPILIPHPPSSQSQFISSHFSSSHPISILSPSPGAYNLEYVAGRVALMAAQYLERRDRGVPSDPRCIVPCSGTAAALVVSVALGCGGGTSMAMRTLRTHQS